MLTLRGIIKTSAANLLGGGLSFLLSVLVARLLTPVENGYYAQFVLIFNLVFIFFNFGIGNGITYFIARGTLSSRAAFGIIGKLAFWLCLLALIAGAVAFESDFVHAQLRQFDIPVPIFLAALGCGLLFLLLNLVAAILLGQQDYDGFNLSTILRSFFPIVLIACICFWLRNDLVFAAMTSVGMLLALFFVIWRARQRGVAVSNDVRTVGMRTIFSYSLLAYFSNVLHYSSMRGVAFALSYYHSAAYVGYFSLSLILLESVLILPGAMGQILFPKSSGSEFNADAINYLIRISVLVGLVASICTAVFGPALVGLILGARYAAVGTTFALMAPSVLLLSVPRILSQVLSGRGKPQFPLYAAMYSSVVCAVAALVFVPRYGIGAAAAAINLISLGTAVVTVWGYARTCSTTMRAAVVPSMADVGSIVRFAAARIKRRAQ